MFETPLFLALGAILAWLSGMLPSAVMQGIPLLCGATGETITEKSGNLNLGIPGIIREARKTSFAPLLRRVR